MATSITTVMSVTRTARLMTATRITVATKILIVMNFTTIIIFIMVIKVSIGKIAIIITVKIRMTMGVLEIAGHTSFPGVGLSTS